MPAGAVALAGGAWTSELARTLGVDIPVTPLKGQIVHLRLPATDSGVVAHRPARARVLPGALAGRTGGLRRHHGGRGRVRPSSDGRRAPPAPARMPPHRSGPGPGHGGGDPGRDRDRRHPTIVPSSARCPGGRMRSWPPATGPRVSSSVPTARWWWPGSCSGSRASVDPMRTELATRDPRPVRARTVHLSDRRNQQRRTGTPPRSPADAGDDRTVEVVAGHAPVIGCIAEVVDGAGRGGDPVPGAAAVGKMAVAMS